MGGIITVIIFILFIARAIKVNEMKRKSMQGNPEDTVKPESVMKPLGAPKSSRTEPTKTSRTAPPKSSRTEPTKSSRTAPAKASRTHEYANDVIVKKSTQNANEKFAEDSLLVDSGKHECCTGGHYEESDDFMKNVEDLMILGPNCSISYERDFVGEGEALVSFF